jgi:hypothetical protein
MSHKKLFNKINANENLQQISVEFVPIRTKK